MYNVPQLQSCFAQLVGFYQSEDPNYPRLSSALTTSLSGKYVQASHALCTIENIYNVAPEFYGYEYPDFSANGAYDSGIVVKFNEVLYKAKHDIAFNNAGLPNPNTVANDWAIFNPFEAWLTKIYNGAVANMASELLKWKKLNNVGRSLIESTQIYTGFGMLEDKIIKKGRFCGFQIYPSKAESLLIRIDQIGFQVDTVQQLNFYLYHSSQVDPLGVFPVNITRAASFSWQKVNDCLLSYMKGNQNSDGCFYIGYYEDDLEGQAIFKENNISMPCRNCGSADVNLFNKWSRHVAIQPMVVNANGVNDDRTFFDESKIGLIYNNNFGINLSLTVMCDLTEFFCKNVSMFADCLSMQVCLDLLQQIAFSTRLNAVTEKTKQLAMAELDTNLKSGSFKAEYILSLQALDYDFSGFDSTCLPCNNRKGIKYEAF